MGTSVKIRLLLILAGVLLPAAAAVAADVPAAVTATRAPPSQAAVPEKTAPEKLAIKGYDPVAYFLDGRAAPGSEKYEYRWNGSVWLFASADHRDRFAKDPEKYAPQYGGYSAFDIYHGRIADADPTLWSIYDGKLYLNGSEADRKLWLADFVDYIESADGKWPKLKPAP